MYIGFPTRLVAVLVFATVMELLPGQGALVVVVKEFQVTKLVLRKSKKEEVVAWLVQLETKLERSATLVPPLANVPIRIKLLVGRLVPSKREMDRFVPAGSMGIRITSLAALTVVENKNSAHPPTRKKEKEKDSKEKGVFGDWLRRRGPFIGQNGRLEGKEVMDFCSSLTI